MRHYTARQWFLFAIGVAAGLSVAPYLVAQPWIAATAALLAIGYHDLATDRPLVLSAVRRELEDVAGGLAYFTRVVVIPCAAIALYAILVILVIDRGAYLGLLFAVSVLLTDRVIAYLIRSSQHRTTVCCPDPTGHDMLDTDTRPTHKEP